MKNIFYLLFISIFVLTSCDKDLDINTNPNTPPDINSGLALSAAQGSIATVLGGDFFNLGGMYAQFYTQAPSAGQYDAIDSYNINTDYANRTWTELYSGCLNDLQFVQNRSEEAGESGTYLIATLLKAYTFQYLVDVFGDVPYTDALQGNDNISPAPTPGADTYADLIKTIDAAVASYNADPVPSKVDAQDIIYGGDMDQWIAFANTLKLKIYLRMAYTPQADATAVQQLISANNFITEDAKFEAFSDASDKRNPYYEVQIEFLGDINDVASNSLFEFYNRNEDPRLQKVFKPNTDGDFAAINQGEGLLESLSGVKATEYSRPNITPTTPVYFMTVAESYFLQAEALVRYSGGNGVQTKYNQGVAASFSQQGVTESAADFTGTGGNYELIPSGTVEGDVEQIIDQKWAALANVNNIEAWIETSRTHFPTLATGPVADVPYEDGRRIISLGSVLSGSQLPLSIYYSDDEVTRNKNLTQKESLTVKVWWNQK